MGLLTLYYASQEQLKVLDPDLVTQYPATVTGTPTTVANPGGPVTNFDPVYDVNNTYLASVRTGVLENTLNITNLDVENPGVNGGPLKDIITNYPATTTGTPTFSKYPTGPPKNFSQPNTPGDTYLANVGTGILKNTLNITSLDVENKGAQGGPKSDGTTQYPATTTGTPTTVANPGGPVRRFNPPYKPTFTYIDYVNTSSLESTLAITNLDVENAGVNGGPLRDITTQYPALNTGTPTPISNPGAAPQRFVQSYAPANTYLGTNPIQGINSGILYNYGSPNNNSLAITNLDVEDSGVNGGPLNDITTNYPAIVTGTPTYTANPGAPAQRFIQYYNPGSTYLGINPVQGIHSGILYDYGTPSNNNSLAITNLDVENPGVNGGPLRDTTTSYPVLSTGTPTLIANPGAAPQRFVQSYAPANTYLGTNPIQGINSGILYDYGNPNNNNSLAITNLDVEYGNVIGGPLNDTTTNYPALNTGTPTPTANPGAAPQRFVQSFAPGNTYLNANPIQGIGSGKLDDTLNITNLDVEDKGVLGGPRSDSTTIYPATTTGTPTTIANPGGPVRRFNPPYKPTFTYINNLPGFGAGALENTLAITNLDVENPGVNGGPLNDTTTVYPISTTGTPTPTANPGSAAKQFVQSYSPNSTYLDASYNVALNNTILSSSLNITNLDTTEPGVNGGIPYKTNNDPTVYPVDTNHTSPIRGYFAVPPSSSKKFEQIFNPKNTYSNFINSYI